MTCPGFEQLIDYLDGRLERKANESVATHLALGCGHCDADRSWFQKVKLVAASDDFIEPPPWVVKRALRLFNTSPVRTSVAARVGRVVASLVFDSLNGRALAGVRSEGVEGRQLLYRAEHVSIDVQLTVSDQMRTELTGQILREGELMFESVAGLQIELMRNGRPILSTLTNDRGEFTIHSIECGIYELRADVGEARITILGLPISD